MTTSKHFTYCPKNIIDLEFERNQRLKRRRDASTDGDGEGETGPNEPNGWRSVLISGLEASTVYEFVVSAANDKGFCEFSIPSDEVPTKRAKEPNTMDAPILSEETTNSIDRRFRFGQILIYRTMDFFFFIRSF